MSGPACTAGTLQATSLCSARKAALPLSDACICRHGEQGATWETRVLHCQGPEQYEINVMAWQELDCVSQ